MVRIPGDAQGPNPWYNNQAYVNTLDKKAIDRFIEVTHEAYKREVGDEFGKAMCLPSLPTNPSSPARARWASAEAQANDVTLPCTDDLADTFSRRLWRGSLWPTLPELIWDLPEGQTVRAPLPLPRPCGGALLPAPLRTTCGGWCTCPRPDADRPYDGRAYTCARQTAALGEAMRSYRSFDLPGIDMLCDRS